VLGLGGVPHAKLPDTQQVHSTSATVFGKKQPFVSLKRGGDYTLHQTTTPYFFPPLGVVAGLPFAAGDSDGGGPCGIIPGGNCCKLCGGGD